MPVREGHRTRNEVMVRDKVASKGLRMSQSFLLPSLKYGRTSCGSSKDRKFEPKIGGKGTVLIRKEQC